MSLKTALGHLRNVNSDEFGEVGCGDDPVTAMPALMHGLALGPCHETIMAIAREAQIWHPELEALTLCIHTSVRTQASLDGCDGPRAPEHETWLILGRARSKPSRADAAAFLRLGLDKLERPEATPEQTAYGAHEQHYLAHDLAVALASYG